jgi:hypothetical protein
MDHTPSCDENAAETRTKNFVEAAMYDAVVRKCPECGVKFIKDLDEGDGCNKIVSK